jgi:hypothetical protein
MKQEIEHKFYVYIYQDELGVPIYVGKGKERGWKIHERLYDHLKIAKTRKKPHPFYFKLRKILRNGFVPKIYKVQENLTGEEANKLEKEIISRFGRKDLKTGTLLNLSDGGQGILNMSENHKNAIRKRHKGKIVPLETRQKISASKKGIPKTAEHKQKLSDSRKGTHPSQQSIEKMKNLRWVNNGLTSKRIYKDELEQYLKNGWQRNRHDFVTIETRQKISVSRKNRPPASLKTRRKIGEKSKKRVWVNNGIKNEFTYHEKAEKLLREGWKKGKFKRKFYWITNGIKSKMVNIGTNLEEGWTLGCTVGKHKKKGKI